MLTLTDRIHGGLAGAVIGDAMGTATETMTRRRIVEVYGRLTEIVAPIESPFSMARPAGRSSDDSSQMLMFAELLADHDQVGIDDIVQILLRWAEDEEMFRTGAGPTTRVAVARLRAGEDPFQVGLGDVHTGTGLSNGAAMKAAPAGWMNPGDIEQAVATAALMATPTHNTQIAIAGAGAVAAAVAVAAAGVTDLGQIVEAAIEGAQRGERIGLVTGREAAGPSIVRRIRESARIGAQADDVWSVLDELSELIGSGLPTVEAVPVAFGLLVAARGSAPDAIIGAVNIGNDTDTVATIAGSIAGTIGGVGSLPAHWVELVGRVNDIDFARLANRIVNRSALHQ